MSRVSTASAAVSKSVFNAMQLPNIPRLTTDEKSRSKYISEYEKFEPELRRHHIGTPETTNTLGLKDVPADFDRTVPSISEPTKAEIEFARQHSTRARSAKKSVDGGAKLTAFAAAAASRPATSNNAMSALAAKRGTMEGRLSSARESLFEGRLPSASKQRPSFITAVQLTEAAETATATEAAASADAAAVDAGQPLTPPEPRFPTPPSQRSLLETRAPDGKAQMTSLSRMRSAPPLTKTTTATANAAAPAQRSMTPPRSNFVRWTRTDPSVPPLPSAAVKDAASAAETARVLCVLLEPPTQYVTSLDLDLSCFDLEWLRLGAVPPRHRTTISNYNDAPGADTHPAKINSPRSVITLLEHGVSLKDWAGGSTDSSTAGSAGARSPPPSAGQSPRLQAELQQHRVARVLARQKAVREELESSYQSLCALAPLQELLTCYRQVRSANAHTDADLGDEEKASLSTVVLQRQERQRRVFETNKMRMLRQVQQAKEMHEHQTIAERRQQQAEADAAEVRRQKAAEEVAARRLQQERLEARRAEREQREEAVRLELQSRMTKVEARNAERVAARERQQKAFHQEREAQAAERARRMERNTTALEEQAALLEQKRLEKEKKLEELRLMRETRLAEEHRLQVEKQLRAAQQRDEARQRAAEAEEAVRVAALERQAQAQARLQDFYARRRDEAAQRAMAESEHQKRIEEARAESAAKEEKFKASIQEKLQRHEERYQDTRARQLADIAWRREAEQEEQEEKANTVLQLHRVAEFNKLRTVVDLLEKRKAANAVTRQRTLICEQAMRDREKLREERESLKQQLACNPL
ncbi:hypothetical protein ABB37_03719 [Leptomonas pyrrhocoris]|uniref:Uncharacterized protein n=1 Tax=Leptomonas pyrrhocoris TaxID=157538 RepID=A0A0M9G3C5_LEPPY|nr:hypothetical protein ABB37_03719 [Leptomonas pyrrhocoris]XP_015659759.1 hypothetical protein ABB37_03719 [Leptomonas pyrrhocoris]KPA81319.1 hypothetical protein ABB37_03719 [Leptomonas pyrrhocoris]KPA81320.1 hypothetical protein ABB37_03719 [Leptomonas pyrrhocoris]|eukprot:XP_015659758.1 hypothetical protein ABB37_03719 [Leptomonas pyrrhocoris]